MEAILATPIVFLWFVVECCIEPRLLAAMLIVAAGNAVLALLTLAIWIVGLAAGMW
jgi:hypothetical protein